jgi:hypothetical protein
MSTDGNKKGPKEQLGKEGVLLLAMSLSVHTIFLAGAYRKTTEQTQCSGPMFPAGLCTTVEKVSSMDITKITLCLSSIASSNGLKGLYFWILYVYTYIFFLMSL